MKRITAVHSLFLIAFSLVITTLMLSSCNLREDLLLPPNLDPKEYLIASKILVYSDHLIPSANDDSFLYLPKESIADHLIWYGDEIRFQKAESMLERDSLAFAEGSASLSNSYLIEIIRAGQNIQLDNTSGFATLYTELTQNTVQGSGTLLSLRYTLNAAPVAIYPYGKKRVFYDVDGSGLFALVNLAPSMLLNIPQSNSDVQALLYNPEESVNLYIPKEFLEELGATQIRLKDTLDTEQLSGLQAIYPGFAMLTKVLEVSTQGEGTSSHTPILHYRHHPAKSGDPQWIKLSAERIDSWPQSDNTWLYQDEALVSFFDGAGAYFLIEPLANSSTLALNLDGSHQQIYLQDLWLDLRSLNLPGYSVLIDRAPGYGELLADYFGTKPYTLSGSAQAFKISFFSGGTLLESLGDEHWIEFGFANQLPQPSSARLMRAFRNADKDILSFKTHAGAYDAEHFSTKDGFVYSGISSSGIYLFGSISESASVLTIPCLKPKLALQTQAGQISYEDPAPPCTELRLEYNASIAESHPWLNGSPYLLQQNRALLGITALGSEAGSDALPKQLFLQTTMQGNPQSIVNFSPLPGYPKFVRYNLANALEHNTFIHESGKYSISPAFSGYLIDAAKLQGSASTRNLAMFPRMIFDDFDLELYLDSGSPMAQPSIMQITKSTALTDTYQILQNQYQLSYLSAAYRFTMQDNPDFYEDFQPYIRLKQNSRTDNLLFSVSNGEFYRIYSYPESATADGYSFLHTDGHFAFLLLYDAEYAVVQDINPHTSAQLVISAIRDAHVSLYQAQAVIPQLYIGAVLPLGTRVNLNRLESVAPGVNFRSAYRIGVLDPQMTPMQPNFFAQIVPNWPYLYVPIPDYIPGQPLRLFFRNPAGITQELDYVESFSEDPATEFIIIGNCAVAFINNPGIFYTQ
jgi:hypothetical protein